MTDPTSQKFVIAAAVGLMAMLHPAHGAILYSSSFENDSETPVGWSSSSNWSVAESSSGKTYAGTDNSSSSYYPSTLGFSAIEDPGDAPVVNFGFDIRIENYRALSSGGAGTFRITLQPNGTVANKYSIGLGYAEIDGSNRLFFYAGAGSSPTPSAANAIGYQAGSGFDTGFDLGALGNNPENGTGGNFYHFELALNTQTGDIAITVTNLSDPSQKAVYSDAWLKTSVTQLGALTFTTGVASEGIMEVDNVIISTVPEPSIYGLAGAAMALGGTVWRATSRKTRR